MAQLEEPEDELIEFDPEELIDDQEDEVNEIIKNKSYIYDPDPEDDTTIEYEPDPRRRRRIRGRGRRLRRYFRRPRGYLRRVRRAYGRVRRSRKSTVSKAVAAIAAPIGLLSGLALVMPQTTFMEKLRGAFYHITNPQLPSLDTFIWRWTNSASAMLKTALFGGVLIAVPYVFKVTKLRVRGLGWVLTIMRVMGPAIILGSVIMSLVVGGSPKGTAPNHSSDRSSNWSEG